MLIEYNIYKAKQKEIVYGKVYRIMFINDYKQRQLFRRKFSATKRR